MSAPRTTKRYASVTPYATITPTRRNQQKRGLKILDGNSPEAHFIRRCTKMLTEHVGGEPTVAQRALIARIAWIELRCSLLDRKAMSDNETPYDVNVYLAHANSLKRLYQALGIEKSRP